MACLIAITSILTLRPRISRGFGRKVNEEAKSAKSRQRAALNPMLMRILRERWGCLRRGIAFCFWCQARQYWLHFTEYMRAPAVQHFASLPDLLLQVDVQIVANGGGCDCKDDVWSFDIVFATRWQIWMGNPSPRRCACRMKSAFD